LSTLNNTEKRKLEELLGMGTGYVLDFSNRTFAEFITDYSGRNIYDWGYEYGSGSKANRLRKFWQVEDDAVVGMLDYGFSGSRDTALAGECRRIVARLLQSDGVSPATAESAPAAQQRSQALAELKAEFFRLAAERDRNKAGLTLEGLPIACSRLSN
jgi:hypothetical protein